MTVRREKGTIVFGLVGLIFSVAYIEITRMCDLRCLHCYHKDNRKDSKMMDLRDYQKLVMSLAHNHRTSRFVILGGEPMLHPQVAEMIKFASCFGSVDICTNGKETRGLLPVVGQIRKYRVSLDGLKRTHDEIRGKGSFDRACASLKKMIDHDCTGSVTTTVHEGNKEEIIALIEKMDRIGVRDIQIQQLINSERTDGLSSLSEEGISALEEKINELRNELNINIVFQREKPVSREKNVISRLTIGPEGDVTFSPDNLGRQKYIAKFDFELSNFVIDIDRLMYQT